MSADVSAPRGTSWPHPARGTCVPGCPVNGRCHCGCEMTPKLARYTQAARSMVAGRPFAYVSGHNPATRRSTRPVWSRNGVPVERVAPLVRYLISVQGSRRKAAQVYHIGQTTLFKVGHRGGMVTPRTALQIVAAVKAHEAALREEAHREERRASNAQREMYRARARERAS